MTVVPAYGRDYTNAKAVKADWAAGKDFQIADMFSGQDGRYVNKADATGLSITARYKGLSQLVKLQ